MEIKVPKASIGGGAQSKKGFRFKRRLLYLIVAGVGLVLLAANKLLFRSGLVYVEPVTRHLFVYSTFLYPNSTRYVSILN